MNAEGIYELTLEELQEKMLAIYAQEGIANTFLAIEAQQNMLAKDFDDMVIKPGSKEFDQYMSWADKSLKIEATQQKRLEMLDDSNMRRARDLRNAARKGSTEEMVRGNFKAELAQKIKDDHK